MTLGLHLFTEYVLSKKKLNINVSLLISSYVYQVLHSNTPLDQWNTTIIQSNTTLVRPISTLTHSLTHSWLENSAEWFFSNTYSTIIYLICEWNIVEFVWIIVKFVLIIVLFEYRQICIWMFGFEWVKVEI